VFKGDIKMCKSEIRIGGSGGQGILLAGVILAEGAINEGKNAVQTQSYGPEARGGASKSEVIISSDEIDFPKVTKCDVFLALTQTAYEKYSKDLNNDNILIVDKSVEVNTQGKSTVYSLPIIETAVDVIKKPIVTNIVALGAISALTEVVSRDTLEKSILYRVPKGTEELNKDALNKGYEMGKKLLN